MLITPEKAMSSPAGESSQSPSMSPVHAMLPSVLPEVAETMKIGFELETVLGSNATPTKVLIIQFINKEIGKFKDKVDGRI